MQSYSESHDRFLIKRNKRLKFIVLYLVLTIVGLFLAEILSRTISIFFRRLLLGSSSASSYEAAMALELIWSQYSLVTFGQIVIKCTQWLALFRYSEINVSWPIAVIISQLIKGFTTAFILGTSGPQGMQVLGTILVFVPSVAESLVLSIYAKYAWLWLAIDVFAYMALALTSRQLKLYPDESPIFLIINLLIFVVKLGCLCLFRRKEQANLSD